MINFDTEIKEQFDLVVKYSQPYLFENNSSINTQPILDIWSKNKEQLYHLMGNKLIYETDEIIEFKLDEDSRAKEKNKFVDFLKMKNRNSAVRDVPKDKREEFEELKVLYLKELDAAKQSAQAAAPEESHEA